jgi:AraC-like DNA-binding protein
MAGHAAIRRRLDATVRISGSAAIPLHFDAERNAITFPATWLKHPLTDADPELSRLLQRQIDALEAEHPDSFPEQVRRVLRTALLTGSGGVDQVAALFSMPSRSLRGRLHASGTRFKAMADEARPELARQMLQNASLDVSKIAASLDYADASPLTRAFRRWTGTTPAAWRAKRAVGTQSVRLQSRGKTG